jgi:hypothetical protein
LAENRNQLYPEHNKKHRQKSEVTIMGKSGEPRFRAALTKQET